MAYFHSTPVPPPPIREFPLDDEQQKPIVTSNKATSLVVPSDGDIELGSKGKSASSNASDTAGSATAAAVEDASLDVSSPSAGKTKEVTFTADFEQLPFEPICFAFKDIWYTVTLPSGEDEPGTVTALMGSSGAGKTTLLDVLSGRKNTGVVKGEMYLNGTLKVEGYFRKVMGYVEQFDTLPQKSTAREAVAFSAALRLSPDITP
jgi:ATPase subunit of ABC transporter with duplicated ATPase domains